MRFLFRFLFCAVVFSGTSTAWADGPKVFAAASLKTALDEVLALWGKDAQAVYAASPALAKQIAAGAPADIFISADEAWLNDVESKDLIRKDSRVDLVGNILVLIAPADSSVVIDLKPGADLLTPLNGSRLAIGETKAVPAGRYAKAALEKLGLWDQVASHLAEQENVRAALQLVDHGEALLGIVYGSDAKADAKVRVVATFPQDSHPPIVYPAAIIAASQSADAAALLDFLKSQPAEAIFARNGFTVLH